MKPYTEWLRRCADILGVEMDTIRYETIEKGGSGRSFFRVAGGAKGAGGSVILVHYGSDRAENRHFVDVARFLASVGVRVPQIFGHDEVERVIWMQDLGGDDLWSKREAPWDERRPWYQKTLEQAAVLHGRAIRTWDPSRLPLQAIFDYDLYRWEQRYFVEHCLAGHFGMRVEDLPIRALEEVARALAEEPRLLVHRDFQSQNVMLRGGEPYLIDFQGMRPGLAAYDLASLLYDPYVSISAKEREELIAFYVALVPRRDGERVVATFDRCAMQRLMQALGAFGNLGHRMGKTRFLEHIPRALASLREVVARIPALDEWGRILENVEG